MSKTKKNWSGILKKYGNIYIYRERYELKKVNKIQNSENFLNISQVTSQEENLHLLIQIGRK